MEKHAAPEEEQESVDCFLKADSMIDRGMCKVLITVVGSESSRGD